VTTYAPRASLSQELEDALKRPLGGAGLAHGATVFGLGGMGKTQLVLRYIEAHKTLYDRVLWLDVHSQETTRSSFERCCRQLGLPIDRRTEAHTLQDSDSVRTVLRWLFCRKEGQEWLVVVDNADDLTWGVLSLIPKGCVGTVVVASIDRAASILLDEKSDVVVVDTMTDGESLTLFLKAVEIKYVVAGHDTRALLEDMVKCLDRFPLAIYLAGHRIRAVARNREDTSSSIGEGPLKKALREYLDDFREHRTKLLNGTGIAWPHSYQKTMWNVWETSFASLRRYQQHHPMQLFALMVQLSSVRAPTQLFQGASYELEHTCEMLRIDVPPWLGETLKLRKDGTWDDFVYKEAVDTLQRFGLVRIVSGEWSGVTMHKSVAWRVAEETRSTEQWTCFLAFIVAVCLHSLSKPALESIATCIRMHLPTTEDLIVKKTLLSVEGLTWTWLTISSFLEGAGRWDECERLHEAILSMQESVLGPRHPTTLLSKEVLIELRIRGWKWERAQHPPVEYMKRATQPPQRHSSSIHDLGFLRHDKHFQHVRGLIETQPALLGLMLHSMTIKDIQLAHMISQNFQGFLRLLEENTFMVRRQVQ
jgi:hypothetical protein